MVPRTAIRHSSGDATERTKSAARCRRPSTMTTTKQQAQHQLSVQPGDHVWVLRGNKMQHQEATVIEVNGESVEVQWQRSRFKEWVEVDRVIPMFDLARDFDANERKGESLRRIYRAKQFHQRRIAKWFQGKIFFGTVTYSDSDTQQTLWHVEYDDGDSEDMTRQEIDVALDLYELRKHTENRSTKQKRSDKQIAATSAANSQSPEENIGETLQGHRHVVTPQRSVQQRIAKMFGDKIYFGSVTSFYDKDGETLWCIEYDDGDSEDMNRKELKSALELYEQWKPADSGTTRDTENPIKAEMFSEEPKPGSCRVAMPRFQKSGTRRRKTVWGSKLDFSRYPSRVDRVVVPSRKVLSPCDSMESDSESESDSSFVFTGDSDSSTSEEGSSCERSSSQSTDTGDSGRCKPDDESFLMSSGGESIDDSWSDNELSFEEDDEDEDLSQVETTDSSSVGSLSELLPPPRRCP